MKNSRITLKQALIQARERLTPGKDVDSPALESEVLLRHVLQINRAQFYTDLEAGLNPLRAAEFTGLVERRLRGEPLAYIIRKREFFGLEFYVDPRVLIPRPESELLVELALDFAKKHPVSAVADIGTGSGAIAVSLAVNLLPEHPSPEIPLNPPSPPLIFAADISPDALEVARINCEKHGVSGRIILLEGDLLNPLPQPVDILIANLPYVKKSDLDRMPSAAYEPALALDGGESGLDKILQLCDQLEGKVNPGGCVLLEIGLGQCQAVTGYLYRLFPSADIRAISDLAGIERVVRLVKK